MIYLEDHLSGTVGISLDKPQIGNVLTRLTNHWIEGWSSKYSHDIPMMFPWYSHPIHIIFLLLCRDFPIISAWYHHYCWLYMPLLIHWRTYKCQDIIKQNIPLIWHRTFSAVHFVPSRPPVVPDSTQRHRERHHMACELAPRHPLQPAVVFGTVQVLIPGDIMET